MLGSICISILPRAAGGCWSNERDCYLVLSASVGAWGPAVAATAVDADATVDASAAVDAAAGDAAATAVVDAGDVDAEAAVHHLISSAC